MHSVCIGSNLRLLVETLLKEMVAGVIDLMGLESFYRLMKDMVGLMLNKNY